MEISPYTQTAPEVEMPSAHDALPFDPSEVTEIASAPVWERLLNGAVMLFFLGLALSLGLMWLSSAFPVKSLLHLNPGG